MAQLTVKNADPIMIRRMASQYITYSHATLEGIAEVNHITAKMVSNLLYRGIADDILPDSVADMVFHKIVYCADKGQMQRRNRWEGAFALRNAKRNSSKIAEVKHQIETYDDYHIEEDGAPTKADLMQQLALLGGGTY